MTYDTRETSIQDGAPVELYKLVLSGRTYYLTTAEEDVQFGGFSWQATPGLDRGPITLQQVSKRRELEITLPRTHAAAQVLMSNGVPPRVATLVLKRFHRSDAEGRQLWSGNIAQVRIAGSYLMLRVPSSADSASDVDLPFIVVSGTCQHMLYGPGCEVDRDYETYETQGFLVATTAVSQSGSVLTVADMDDDDDNPHPAQWAQFGEVRRLVDGERRAILDHTGAALTLDAPFPSIVGGDELEVWAGCDHSITMCRSKFNNAPNFGGHFEAPLTNPMNQTDEG